ncbi:radical S-adenosyl methionine domain-containing protein 1, mitochondrial-like [Hetaerina americana]|uniref:radical S-adenosyl methionine domain-containing protein 1, mitochondrial-like n=1 Tax=Hetaerina americana TaxID=62018 RepID=UPI003A7F4CD4
MRIFGMFHLIKMFRVGYREEFKFISKQLRMIHNDDIQYPGFYLEEASIYVHWPYCRKRCHFCNFNKYIDDNVNHMRMRACLVKEINTIIRECSVKRINSVFFGGGTPNLAEPATIEAVLNAVSNCTELVTGSEITMETNPIGNGSSKLEDFKAAGINRVSVGVQALDDSSLGLLGRDHSVLDALKTLDTAKMLFPHRSSVDILYGLPGQSLESWSATLSKLIPLLDDHISVYQLTLERGTKLFKMCEEGRLAIPEEDVLADMYDLTLEKLDSVGFIAYEISNYSRSLEAQSTHNKAYWQGKQYIGIGPGAHSRFVPLTSDSSSYNLERMGSEKWMQGMREARIQTLEPIPWMREVEKVGHGTRLRRQQNKREVLGELLAVGLRTLEGVTEESWRALSSRAPTLSECFAESPRLAWLFESGLLTFSTSGAIRATRRGWKVLDRIVPHLLDELERALGERGM